MVLYNILKKVIAIYGKEYLGIQDNDIALTCCNYNLTRFVKKRHQVHLKEQ